MNLKEQISEDLKSAMKAKDATKLSILRVLKSEIERNSQTADGKIELPDGEVAKLAKKLIDGIKETTANQDEILVLETYVPKQLSEEEMKNIISLLSVKNMGEIMKYFKTNYDGTYDGKILSTLAKEALA